LHILLEILNKSTDFIDLSFIMELMQKWDESVEFSPSFNYFTEGANMPNKDRYFWKNNSWKKIFFANKICGEKIQIVSDRYHFSSAIWYTFRVKNTDGYN